MISETFAIKNRNGIVIFAAEITCSANASEGVKLGQAVQAAYLAGTNLTLADLTRASLTRADLTGANLTGANLMCTDLTGASLEGANLSGADLTRASLTRASLWNANLTGADLTRADLTRADLTGANLTGADLTRANITNANLWNTDLSGASLDGASLARALQIDDADIPAVPHIDAAILDAIDRDGLLDMRSWHSCETTHCRAGWAIHLAGGAGYALEHRVGSQLAGALIYLQSRPGPIPAFFASDDAALADIRKCARDA